MTDQIVPPEEPSSPPVITSNPEVGSIIRFNAEKSNALRIPITVWDENTTEELKVHFLLESTSLTPVNDRPEPDFPCKEDIIAGTGLVLRTEFGLSIPATKIPRNACTKLSVAVSSSFLPCDKFKRAEDWSKTSVPGDDTGHRGLAVYWVWEVSADPLVNPESAQRLLSTCPQTMGNDATAPRSN